MKFEEIERNVNSVVPGESMVADPKQFPWQRPAKTANPMAGIEMLFDTMFGNPKVARKLRKTIKGGVPKEVIADGLGMMLHGEGVVSPQALPVMLPSINALLEGFAEKAGLTFEETEKENPWVTPDEDEVNELVRKSNEALDLVNEAFEGVRPEQEGEEEVIEEQENTDLSEPSPVSGGIMSMPEPVEGEL